MSIPIQMPLNPIEQGRILTKIHCGLLTMNNPKILTDTAAIEFFNHYCNTGEYLDESVKGGYWFENGIWFAFDSSSDELYQEEFKYKRYAKLYANSEESITKQGQLI